MITRGDAVDEGGLLRPLEQLKQEEEDRVEKTIAALDREYEREFSVGKRPAASPGPEPWNGFLDLSLL